MKTYGLIGYPLAHSFSERYFSEKFSREGIEECAYRNFALTSIELLPRLLAETPTICGLNVTIPYKEAVIPYLTHLDEQAQRVGAVNCIRIEGRNITGYNTDVYGFSNSLLALIGDARHDALVLGNGGASKAAQYVLGELGITYRIVSRKKTPETLSYEELTKSILSDHRLIINTTPLGTFPQIDTCPPIPYESITPAHFLFDMVYNPPMTRFLTLGEQHGAKTMNGSRMLIDQAEKSWEIWNRKDF